MSDKVICPEDGLVCDMTEDEKKGQGCWLCPKIQGALQKMNERKGEVSGGEEST